MSANIIYPNIKGSDAEQLRQIRSYLYQLAEQLNFALSQTGAGNAPNTAPAVQPSVTPGTPAAEDTFNAVKALIIKSADIVNAYYEEIDSRLVSEYVAISEYGTFKETTENELHAEASLLSSVITDIQSIDGDVSTLKETNAYFKAGELEEGVYGIEIGRTTEEGGEIVFARYARFLPNRLSFYDSAGNELAYFSDYRLHVNGIETNEIKLGGYRLDTHDGLAFIWEGV